MSEFNFQLDITTQVKATDVYEAVRSLLIRLGHRVETTQVGDIVTIKVDK